MYVSAETPASELRLELEKRLRGNDYAVSSEASGANAEIRLLNEREGRSLLSTDTSGNILEYELRFSVTWSLIHGAFAVMGPRTDSARRAYRYNDANILANEAEARVLQQEMREEVAAAILRQISSTPAASTATPPAN